VTLAVYPRCVTCMRRVPPGEGYELDAGGVACAVCLLACTPEEDIEERMVRETADGKKPRPFQVDAIRWMSGRRRGLIADEMGCGKTIEAIFGSLRADCPNIVVVPSSMKMTWLREINEWRPELKPVIAEGKATWGVEFRSLRAGSVLISSYGVLPGEPCPGCRSRDVEACSHTSPDRAHPEWVKEGGVYRPYHLPGGKGRARREKIEAMVRGEIPIPGGLRYQVNPMPEIEGRYVLVGDEIHAVKNPEAKRTKRWRELAERVADAGGYVWGMSGTPVENHPEEYWQVLVSLGLAAASFGTYDLWEDLFSDWYMNDKGDRRPPKGRDLNEVLVRLSRVRMRRRTEEVLPDLPPVQEQQIDVDISPKRMAEVNAAVQRMLAARRAWEDVEAGLLANPWDAGLEEDEAARRQAVYDATIERYVPVVDQSDSEIKKAIEEVVQPKSLHPGIGEMSRVRRLLSVAKVEAVEQWVRNCEAEGQPVVLFCQHVDVVKRFGERPGWTPFHGGVDEKVRDQAMVDFQSGKITRGIAVSLGAGREGITLTRSRVAGFVDLNWNPARNRQAVARVRRLGSEKHDSILVVRFIANHPVDQLVLETLREKERLLDALDGLPIEFNNEGES
jgi:SNF2 family DNA or RNA helicase